tara:strand:- start:11282 stop:12172 length:891 start_codon:yes stop_codon:yes gene_type:complete
MMRWYLAALAAQVFGGFWLFTPPALAGNSSRLIWAEEFDAPLDLASNEHVGTWRANDTFQNANLGYKDYAGGSWNINPNQHPAYSPFTVTDGILTIKATRTPPAIVTDIEALRGPGQVPAWSGGILITNHQLRSFKYGYFEMRARWPVSGKGMFPAFWLYTADGRRLKDPRKSGAEIDIFEILGHALGRPWEATVHRRDWQGIGDMSAVGEFDQETSGWHSYGVDWQPNWLRFYRDRKLLGELTGADARWFNVEMSIRVNFAVDGAHISKLGRASDYTTPDVMMMLVDYVRVYDKY